MSGAFERLGTAGRIAAIAGTVVACGVMLSLAVALLGGESGGESGGGHPAASTGQSGAQRELRGACTLAREDGSLEQITLTGKPVSKRFCQAFASYLEETTGVEEPTWIPRAPAKPLSRQNCSRCTVKPACKVSIAAAKRPGEPVSFTVEAEEAYDELHYDPIYTHDVCELLDGGIEVQRFIAQEQAG